MKYGYFLTQKAKLGRSKSWSCNWDTQWALGLTKLKTLAPDNFPQWLQYVRQSHKFPPQFSSGGCQIQCGNNWNLALQADLLRPLRSSSRVKETVLVYIWVHSVGREVSLGVSGFLRRLRDDKDLATLWRYFCKQYVQGVFLLDTRLPCSLSKSDVHAKAKINRIKGCAWI